MAHNGSRLAAVIEKELKAKLIQMKIELQELIKELEIEKAEANLAYIKNSGTYTRGKAYGKELAFDFCIEKLTLLLNSESENSGKNDADNSGKPM